MIHYTNAKSHFSKDALKLQLQMIKNYPKLVANHRMKSCHNNIWMDKILLIVKLEKIFK